MFELPQGEKSQFAVIANSLQISALNAAPKKHPFESFVPAIVMYKAKNRSSQSAALPGIGHRWGKRAVGSRLGFDSVTGKAGQVAIGISLFNKGVSNYFSSGAGGNVTSYITMAEVKLFDSRQVERMGPESSLRLFRQVFEVMREQRIVAGSKDSEECLTIVVCF